MAIDKSSVLVGSHPLTGLDVHRRFLEFKASRKDETIQVFYEEFYLVNGIEVEKNIFPKFYVVKDLLQGQEANGQIMVDDFLGFTNWYTHSVSGLPNGTELGDDIFVPAINAALQGIPIGVLAGYVITQSV